MDVNGLRAWPLMDRRALGFVREGEDAPRDVAWDAPGASACAGLRLARRQAAPALDENGPWARSQAARPAPVCDPAGSWAWWDGSALHAGGFRPGAAPIPLPPEIPPGAEQPQDLAFGTDDVLYVARNGAVTLVDRRERWAPARVAHPDFAARKLAPAAGGGVWALDRGRGQVARLLGRPLRTSGARPEPSDEVFQPVEPNPDPPRLVPLPEAVLPPGREAALIAGSAGGRLALIAWRDGGRPAELWELVEGRLVLRFALEGVRRPFSIAWIGEGAVAAMVSEGEAVAPQALVYEIDAAAASPGLARPLGAVHRVLRPFRTAFCNALDATPRYLAGPPGGDGPEALRALRPLSFASFARRGSIRPGALDGGEAGFVWHRAAFEAEVPDGTGAILWALASDDPTPPPLPGAAGAPVWAPHLVGRAGAGEVPADAPRAAPTARASEPDYHPGALEDGAPHTLLLQHAGRVVRRLAGRFLHLHVELLGDGRASPRLASLRVHGGRFSYRDRYLPAMFHETLSGAEAAAPGPATPPDFMERLLALFESRFTEIEDRIAAAWLLTDPGATPDDALPWLASWVGIPEIPGEAPARLRERLKAAPWTARLHGTAGGVLAALELATGGVTVTGAPVDRLDEAPAPGSLALARDGEAAYRVLTLGLADPRNGGEAAFLFGGAVTGGEIVMVEGFRLRRTFATILGADLSDRDNPLTLGGEPSGNSIVGDTLILGERRARRLLNALTATTPRGRRQVEAFLDRLAHRALVLVRESASTRDLERLEEVARAAAPAHVEIEVMRADRPLRVAVASLVGIDTYLAAPQGPRPARLDRRTHLADGDQVWGFGRLDARAEGPAPRPPVAVLDGPAFVGAGREFLLSSARSTAFGGRDVARSIFLWD
ncbi:phage tail protein [Albimonas sp. CAU 1670]|uniref:phage tail protein n=1 Tax=Albimonas sp. CAU 1670 TaxID=3032599 RepID=UPI0023DA4760|nr:phage tail protein [Albimonas sp. CAU 1670]MDF2235419.1 phage tail protein [Albimonas sp. CAU 1670]